ncbi:glycosidase [Arthrobacter sp. JSM 101049]|uniref:pullulanase X25 domain-containing protein n=1 Tax=Arthrobacter sp. JSM 101049 TaxID=929097 RepID=UPI0035619C37
MATPETNLRLKSVLDILAEAHRDGSRPDAKQVITEALLRVPTTAHERDLLSGGVPRGFKNLTTATARLVKAGWMTKGRGGWAVTGEGLHEARALADPQALLLALDGGTPLPEASPVPVSSEAAPQLSVVPEQVVPAPALGQPSAVALVGDFNMLLGADRDWDPEAEQTQMTFDLTDGVWKLEADLPAGTYAFKFALERSWTENHGAFGPRDGANHEVWHDGGPIVFAYDHSTRDIAAGAGFAQDEELLASA